MVKLCNDCLNLIRLLAAIGVMYGHTVHHLSLEIPSVVSQYLWLPGVPLFFCLSGYLIWPSIGRSRTFVEYCRKRFWRIYPELWGAVLLNAVIILLLYQESIEWFKLALFTVTQSTFFQFWTPDFLRGYGCGTPNGSLWTICVIVQFYALAFVLYKFVYKKNKVQLILLFLFVVLGALHGTITSRVPEIIGKLYGVSVFPYMWMFLLGALLNDNKDRCLPFFQKAWFPLLLLTYVVFKTKFDIYLVNYGFIASTLSFMGFLGFAYRFPKLNLKVDVSYAVYVYHMVVVNAFIALGLVNNLWYLALVFVITFLIGYVSTKTIGAFGLRKKTKLG